MLRVTKTENGMVKGFAGTDARITVFKGIPYAADTSGKNRWRAPQPVENWEGIRECYEFGPITMQAVPGKNPEAFYAKEWHVDPEVAMGEDGLRVNIWTPAKTADEKLPVMVWIFGGGFREGYAHEMEFDGERIASRGVILVSVAYRLNAFGFLAHPELTAENEGRPATNFGLQDQLAGIEWVERNIANFGGDPKNITIFGQSAGGGSVWTHLQSPMSKGHFQKAIPQSAGGVNTPFPIRMMRLRRQTLADAEQIGIKFVKEYLGCNSIEEARKLDAQFIEDKFHEAGLNISPCIDGIFTTEDTSEAVQFGRLHDVPIMTGNTTDEFLVGPDGDDMASIEAWVRDSFAQHADEFLALMKQECGDDAAACKKFATINAFELAARLVCEYYAEHGKDLHYYQFGPTIPGDNAGAFHSSDLWFEFETLMKCWRPFDGHHFDLARKMCNYWTNFAKTGDPNGNDKDGTPMPEWAAYTTDNKQGIQFFDTIQMSTGEFDARTQFLMKINREELDK